MEPQEQGAGPTRQWPLARTQPAAVEENPMQGDSTELAQAIAKYKSKSQNRTVEFARPISIPQSLCNGG